MLFRSVVEAGGIDTSGALKQCAELCPDCPRRTGEVSVRAKGIKGLFGKKETRTQHYSPLKSGAIRRVLTDGYDGIFYGDGQENSGTVTGLRKETAARFLSKVIGCDGPVEDGNVCAALGPKSLRAIAGLDQSMEDAIDQLPIEQVVASIAGEPVEPPAEELPATQVFINHSQPGSS